jgi:hypothetical protein
MCVSSTTYCLPTLTFQLVREVVALVLTADYKEGMGNAMTHMLAAETPPHLTIRT